jgi:ornithine cyclodeaminase/alanine dehydrogenase-like protein (mu-crystallin family)
VPIPAVTAAMSLLVLGEAEIRSVLSPRAAIDSQRTAFVAVADGQVAASGITSSRDPADDSLTFAHTGAIRGMTGVTCKFGLQVPGNAARGLPTVHAIVTVLRPATGEPLACLNGAAVTALRTAAGVAAAAEVLARPDASRLGLIGAGVQAREAARMISAVRALSQIQVFSLSAQRSAVLAGELQAELGVPSAAASSAARLAGECDIVVTATTSREPVVRGSWLRSGATVLTVGSYEPGRRELDLAATVRADATFADDPVKAMSCCGMLVEAREQGVPTEANQIGEVIAGRTQGRRAAEDVVLFHSTGLGIQDASLAWTVLQLAAAQGVGKKVEF